MKEIKIGKHRVKMYDSIEDLPVVRYHRFNKFMLIDAGLGADLTEIDLKIHKTMSFLNTGDVKSAVAELMNLRQSVYLLQNEITPKYIAFAALVVEVDGKVYDDITEDGLRKTASLFDDTSVKELEQEIKSVKKKLESEIGLYAPGLFNDSKVKEYYTKLKRRTILICDAILAGKDPDTVKEIEDLSNEMLLMNKPLSFQGENSMEIKQDKDFEYACLTISQHLNADAKAFTVLEYYNALNYIQDLARDQKKNTGNRGLRK